MDGERLFERIREYQKALTLLSEAVALKDDPIVRDALIKRFEFTYELAWKAVRLWLEYRNIDVHYAKDAFREALQQGWIEDGNGWTQLQKMRNLTSHTYDEATAREVADFVRNKGIVLLKALDERFGKMTGNP